MSSEHVIQGEIVPASSGLTPTQLQAAVVDASGATRDDVARMVGVSASAIKQWRAKPEYQAEVERLRHAVLESVTEAVKQLKSELTLAARKAIDTLVENLDAEDKNGRPMYSTRREAAEILLKHGIDLLKEAEAAKQKAAMSPAGPTAPVQVIINRDSPPPPPQ